MIREIRLDSDEILRKKSKIVNNINENIINILNDMRETMEDANGVGLAAPQIGILRRIIIINVNDEFIEAINPIIIEEEGTQTGQEGCLSVPYKVGDVTRPNYCKVKALNRKGEEIIIEGTELKARAIFHEIDHLDGILYIDKVIGELEFCD